MKKDNILVLAGAVLAGMSYITGKKAGKKEMGYKVQEELLKLMIDAKKAEGSE